MNSTPETKLQSGYDLEVTNLASHLLQHWPTTLPQKLLHWTIFSLGVLGKPKDIKTARTAQHTFKNNRISHDSSLCRCVGEKENSFLLIHSKYNRKKVPKLTKWIGTFVAYSILQKGHRWMKTSVIPLEWKAGFKWTKCKLSGTNTALERWA